METTTPEVATKHQMETTTADVVIKHYSLHVIEVVTISILACIVVYLAISSLVYLIAKNEDELKTVNRCCCVASFILLISLLPLPLTITANQLSLEICSYILQMLGFTNMGNRFSVYLILWLRQHALYKSVTSPTKWSRVIKYANKLVLLLFAVLSVVPIPLLLLYATPNYTVNLGCSFEEMGSLFALVYGGYILSHFFLLFLMLLPLSTYYRNLSGAQQVSKRLIASTVSCVLADFLLSALVVFLHPSVRSSPHLSPNLLRCMYIMDHIVLNVSLIFSFPNYKQRFFPFPLVLENRRNRVTPTFSLPYMG